MKATHQKALQRALFLALTAPEHRLKDSLNLVEELAELCTPVEVAQAQGEALKIFTEADENEIT